MTLIVNNDTNSNVILSIDDNNYIIKANEQNVVLTAADKNILLSVKREKSLPSPSYKKMLLTELLGIAAILFIKPSFYVLDISSTHKLTMNNDFVTVNIVQNERHPDRLIYDAITVRSTDVALENSTYRVENKEEIISVYDKCKKVAHLWLYAVLEALFTLIGIFITYPPLLAIYLATNAAIIKIIMIIIPIFLLGIIALIGVLPLHFLFNHHKKEFYRSMENNEISQHLKKQ